MSDSRNQPFEQPEQHPLLSRRSILRRGLALSLTIPAAGILLAACGDDNDEPTATTAAGTTPTAGAGGDSTPTEAMEDATPTEAMVEETPTEGMAEETPTEAMAEEPTPTSGDAGGVNPRHYGFEIDPPESEGGTLIFTAVVGDVRNLNPLGGDWGGGYYVYESLWEYNPNTIEPEPVLAESWETSEDALVWTFNLRQGVLWHDGEEFTADDVLFTYQVQMDESGPSEYAAQFIDEIASIEAPDDYTVVFTTTRLLVDFLANDAFSPIIAEHVVSQLPIEGLETTAFGTGEDPAFVVGTGPFRLQEYVVDDHVTLARFDDYWDGAPILDEIVTRMLADSQSAVSQLQTGAVDVAFLDPNSINQFEGTDVEVIEYLTTGIRFLALNQDTEQTTLFVDAPVRHALLHAIDRQALVDSVLLGYGEVQNSYLPSWIWANPPELIEVEYPYDPELAGQLLDEAGWLMGPDGIRERDGQKFQFTLWGNAGDPVQEATNAVIQEQWRQIGVACELQVETEDALYERYVEVKNYEAAFWRVFNTTPDLTWLFATDSYPDSGNRFKYSNPEADALMEQALSEPDPEARTALTAQIQNIILADLPILPLYANYPLQGVSQRVHNYHPSEINDYFNAETWWIEQ